MNCIFVRSVAVFVLVFATFAPLRTLGAITAPTDLSGLHLWLDAADAGSITTVGGDVQTWNDKSGQANHISAAAPVNRPDYWLGAQNGRNIVTFDGTNHSIGTGTFGFSNTFDVFLVAWPLKTITVNTVNANGTSGTSGQAYAWAPEFVSSGTGRGTGLSLGTNGLSVYQHTDGTLTPLASTSTATSDFNIYAVRYNAGVPSIDVNGTTVPSGSMSSGATIFPSKQFGNVGSGGDPTGFGGFRGGLAEVLVFNRQLTGTEYSDVQSYLATKWNPAVDPYWPVGVPLYLSTDVMGVGGNFSTGSFDAQDGYTNLGTVELVGKISNLNKAATPVTRLGGSGPIIDFSAHVVGDSTAGDWGSDVHGRGGNLWLPGDGETNVPHAGFGAHANKYVTFDLQDIRDEFFAGFSGDLRLDGKVGVNGNTDSNQNPAIQGGVWIDGVLANVSDIQDFSEASHVFSITIPDSAQFLTLAMLNGNASTVFDDVAFRDVTLTAVPEPSSVVLAFFGLLGLAATRRRHQLCC